MGDFEELVTSKYNSDRKLLVKRVYNRVKDHHIAEDIVQEAFCRALKYKGSYDQSLPFDNWFNYILRNAQSDIVRSNSVVPITPCIDEFSIDDFVDEDHMPRELLVNEISKVLNGDHREVLCLFVLGGYTSKEISEIRPNMSQTNVTTIFNRWISKVREDNG